MYHRVLPSHDISTCVQPGMYVTPELLKSHIGFLREQFEVVPLACLSNLSQCTAHEKPLCALTFDDGWADFYTNAYPVLLEEKIPATVFLPTDYIDTLRWFWTDELGQLLKQLAKFGLPNGNWDDPAADPYVISILHTRHFQRTTQEAIIAKLKKLPAARIEKILTQLSTAIGFSPSARGRAFLTWIEVQEMFQSKLVSFGSHTASHALLTTVSAQEAIVEMARSKGALLERGVAFSDHMEFSFPNGDHTPALANSVRESGYKLAATTKRGWHQLGADPYTMKRIAIHQDVAASEAMFAARIAGLV